MPPRSARPRRLGLRLLVGALLISLFSFVALFCWGLTSGDGGARREFVVGPVAPEDDIRPPVAPSRVGSSTAEPTAALAARLGALGLVDHPRLLAFYLSVFRFGRDFPSRSHLLEPGLPARDLLRRLLDRPRPEVTRVTIPEGDNRFEIGERLERAGVCAARAFVEVSGSRQFVVELGVAGSVEGYLFPDTYELRLDDEPHRLVRRLVGEARSRHAKVMGPDGVLPGEARALGLSFHDVLTLASVVEKETGRAGERARIARVFYNRLGDRAGETGGRLESDPTARYGCLASGGAYSTCDGGNVPTSEMVHDPDNPYGTYARPGLPPGPIGNPGEAALRAVLAPAPGKERYFVADGSGGHVFSETFQQHKKAVAALRERRGRDPGRSSAPGDE